MKNYFIELYGHQSRASKDKCYGFNYFKIESNDLKSLRKELESKVVEFKSNLKPSNVNFVQAYTIIPKMEMIYFHMKFLNINYATNFLHSWICFR